MDQLLRLLRGKCVYCGHLKLHPARVNLYACKLRLLHHGLSREAEEVENVGTKPKSMIGLPNGVGEEVGQESEEDSEDEEDLTEKRKLFTKRAIREAGGGDARRYLSREKIEVLSEHRRAVVKDFLGDLTKGRSCGRCNGYTISPGSCAA